MDQAVIQCARGEKNLHLQLLYQSIEDHDHPITTGFFWFLQVQIIARRKQCFQLDTTHYSVNHITAPLLMQTPLIPSWVRRVLVCS